MSETSMKTRREMIVAALAAGAGAAIAAHSDAAEPKAVPAPAVKPTGHEHDWDWLVGSWNVRHRRLKERLTGNTEWEEFDGTSTMWLTLGGLGTLDDNWIEIPSGAYRAVGIRAFDAKTGLWSIWWLDGRYPATIEPPVRGGFKDGIGEFVGDDTLRGKPIRARFRWTAITATSAHWEQAFSGDGGATWEDNWHMQFTRAPG